MNDSLMSDDVIPKYYLLVITTIPCFLNRENRNLRVSCWILKIRAVLSVFWQLLINLNSWKWIKVRTGWVIVFGNSSPTFFLFIFWSFFVNLFSGTIQNLEISSNFTHPNFQKNFKGSPQLTSAFFSSPSVSRSESSSIFSFSFFFCSFFCSSLASTSNCAVIPVFDFAKSVR